MTVRLVLMLVFGAAGVHHARHLEKKYGRSAWGLSSWVWGIITALSLLIGAILLYVAERGLKRETAPAQPLGPDQGLGYGGVPAQAGPPASAPALTPAVAMSVSAAWHPDPSGRHELRWWDGERWTTTVHSNGVTSSEG